MPQANGAGLLSRASHKARKSAVFGSISTRMPTFSASLRTEGDLTALRTTIELEQGRLIISAGDTPIGDWDIAEVSLEKVKTGFRLDVEGEHVLLDMTESEAIALDLRYAAGSRSRPARKRKDPRPPRAREEKAPKPKREKAPKPKREKAPKPPEAKRPKRQNRAKRAEEAKRSEPQAAETPAPAVEKEPERRAKPRGPSRGRRLGVRIAKSSRRAMDGVDGILDRAEKRWGPLLPDWVFTRPVFLIALAAIIAGSFLPKIAAASLLLTGALAVLVGTFTYADSVLASKWLPGRTGPVHLLVTGLVVLVLGLLLGLLA